MLKGSLRLVAVTLFIILLFASLTWFLNRNVKTYDRAAASKNDGLVTQPVTVEDVLAADILRPVIDKVSFPKFTYQQAFPDTNDEPEMVIDHFGQAPMLADMTTIPAKWRMHYPQTLPPVEERLPRNPAVVRGPDGVGNYGGTWHRVVRGNFAWDRAIMYETFIRNDAAGRPSPCIAYRWEVEDNNRVFTFYMRKGHKWSDGHPFTSHDIAWICNELIGSPYWMSIPNWMQSRNGALMFYAEDILDWRGLAEAIMVQVASGGLTPGGQLFINPTPNPAFTEEVAIQLENEKCEQLRKNQVKLRKVLQNIVSLPDGEQPGEALRNSFIDLLNRVIKNRHYFDEQAWQAVDLKSEVQRMRKIGPSRMSKEMFERYLMLLDRDSMAKHVNTLKQDEYNVRRVGKLNILMFRAAYREYVRPAEQSRVKIEPVDDGTGDDSHIIRFTFPRPASFFLEKTTTFMFYRGLFVIAPHQVKTFHPDGSDRLEAVDIYDWQGLSEALIAAGKAEEASALKQMWKLMPDEVRSRIIDGQWGKRIAADEKQRAIAAINDVLANRRFYAKQLWANIDLDSEMKRRLARDGGFNEIVNRSDEYKRIKELLMREDLVRWVHEEGIDALDDEQVYQFNQFMFRALLDDPVGGVGMGIVAVNREQGINHKTQTAAKPYMSWLQKMHALRRNPYHPVENPHMPTLKSWRIVSERIDKNAVAVRNPYYYRVDELGNQLPYLDAVETFIEPDREARLLKIRSGNVDFQSQEIKLSDYTVLKQNEQAGGYQTRLWAADSCGAVMLYSNYRHSVMMYRYLQTDPRFRHALSAAINRQEIIDVVYAGLGKPSQYAIPKGSVYYNEKLANAFVEYDPELANRLLDEMGLDKRDRDGTRLVPLAGKPGEPTRYEPLIYIIYTDEQHLPIQVVEMVCRYWQAIGINAQMKLTTKLTYLSGLGLLDAAAVGGGGSYFGPLHAGVFAPTHSAEGPHWGGWVNYLRSNGTQGTEPPEWVMDRERQWNKVIHSENDEAKYAAWQELMDANAEMLPVIGILNLPGKVVVVRNNFKNVPKLAFGGTIPHDPGNACPELFYFEKEDKSHVKKYSTK